MTSRALKKRYNKREKRKRKRKEEAEANATANDEDEAVVLQMQMLEEAERQEQNRMWEERERQAQILWEQHRKDAEEEERQKRVQEQSVPMLKDNTTIPHTGRPLSPQQQLLLNEQTNADPRLYYEGHSPEFRNSASLRDHHSEEYGTEKVRRSSPYFETSSLP